MSLEDKAIRQGETSLGADQMTVAPAEIMNGGAPQDVLQQEQTPQQITTNNAAAAVDAQNVGAILGQEGYREAAPSSDIGVKLQDGEDVFDHDTPQQEVGEPGQLLELGGVQPAQLEIELPETESLEAAERSNAQMVAFANLVHLQQQAQDNFKRACEKLDALAGFYIKQRRDKFAEDKSIQYLADERLDSLPGERDMLVGQEAARAMNMDAATAVWEYAQRKEGEEHAKALQRIGACKSVEDAHRLLGEFLREDALQVQAEYDRLDALAAQELVEWNKVDAKFVAQGKLSPEEQLYHSRGCKFTPAQYDSARRVAELAKDTDVRDVDFVRKAARIVGDDDALQQWFLQFCMARGRSERNDQNGFTHALSEIGHDISQWIQYDNVSINSSKAFWNALFSEVSQTEKQIPRDGSTGTALKRLWNTSKNIVLNHSGDVYLAALSDNDDRNTSIMLGNAIRGYQAGVHDAEKPKEEESMFASAWRLGGSTISALISLGYDLPKLTLPGIFVFYAHNQRVNNALSWSDAVLKAQKKGKTWRSVDSQAVGIDSHISTFAENLVAVTLGPALGYTKFGWKLLGKDIGSRLPEKAASWLKNHPWTSYGLHSLESYAILQWGFPAMTAGVKESLQIAFLDDKGMRHSWADYCKGLQDQTWRDHFVSGILGLTLGGLHAAADIIGKQDPLADTLASKDIEKNKTARQVFEQDKVDRHRTAQLKKLAVELFGEERANQLFSGDINAAMMALREEMLKDPSAFAEKMHKVGMQIDAADKFDEAYRSGVIGYVLKRAGYSEMEELPHDKVRLKFNVVDKDGTTQEREVVWSRHQLSDWLRSRIDDHITRCVENTQARVRGEQVRRADQDTKTFWWALQGDLAAKLPQEVLDKIPAEEIASGELSAESLEVMAAYAAERIGGTFGSTGVPNAKVANLAKDAGARAQGDSAAVFPLFQMRNSAGDMVIYHATGRITERDILHELLERNLRNDLDNGILSLEKAVHVLLDIQAASGVKLLPDKEISEFSHLDVVEGMTRLAESELLHSLHVPDNSASARVRQGVVDALGDTELLMKLGDNAHRLLDKGGEAAYKDVRGILQRAGLNVTDILQRSYQRGYKEALQVVKDADARARGESVLEGPVKVLKAEQKVEGVKIDGHEAVPQESIDRETADMPSGPGREKPTSAEFTLTGEEASAESNRPLGRIDQQSGQYLPTRISPVLRDGVRGRGLVNGEFSENGDGTVTGSCALDSIGFIAEPSADAIMKAIKASQEYMPVTVLRFANGKMLAVDGYEFINAARIRGEKFVEVCVHDVKGSSGMADARRLTGNYMMRIGAMGKAALLKHIDKYGLTRDEAERLHLIPRDEFGQELPDSRQAWQERGATFMARARSEFKDVRDSEEERIFRDVASVRNSILSDISALCCTDRGFPLTGKFLASELAKDGREASAAAIVQFMHDRLQQAIGLTKGRLKGLHETLGNILGTEPTEPVTEWVDALQKWLQGRKVEKAPYGMSITDFNNLNVGLSPLAHLELLAHVLKTYGKLVVRETLGVQLDAVRQRILDGLHAFAMTYMPPEMEGKDTKARTTAEAWKFFEIAWNAINTDADKAHEKAQAIQKTLDEAQKKDLPNVYQLRRELAIWISYGGLRERGVEDMLQASNVLKSMLVDGGVEMAQRRALYQREVNSCRKDINDAAAKKQRGGIIDITDQDRNNERRPFHNTMNRLRALMSPFQRIDSKRFGYAGATLGQWADSRANADLSYQRVMVKLSQDFKTFYTANGITPAKFAELKRIVPSGISFRGVRVRMPEGEVPEDAPESYKYTVNMNMGSENWKLSRLQAALVCLMYEQERGARHLEKWGIDAGVVRQLYDFAGEEALKVAYWCRDYLGGQDIGAVFEERTGCPFHYERNYFPMLFNLQNEQSGRTGMDGVAGSSGISAYSFLFQRVEHDLKPELTEDVLTVFYAAMEGVSLYKFKAPVAQLMRDTFRDQATFESGKEVIGGSDALQLLEDAGIIEHAFLPTSHAALPRNRHAWSKNVAKAFAFLLGSIPSMARNFVGAAFNYTSDPMFRGIGGKGKLTATTLRGIAGHILSATAGIAKFGPERFFRGLQELQQDKAPMNLVRMLQHPAFQARLPMSESERISKMPPDTPYNKFTTGVKQFLMNLTLNYFDVVGNAITQCMVYNQHYRDCRKRGASEREAVAFADMQLAANLLRGAQPIGAESKATTQLVQPDPGITEYLFSKSEIVNKICQAISTFRQTRDLYGGGVRGGFAGFLDSIMYLHPFAFAEQAVTAGLTWYTQDMCNADEDKQAQFVMNNFIAAFLLVPTLNIGYLQSAAVSIVNEKILPENWQIATYGTTGQISEWNNIEDIWNDLADIWNGTTNGDWNNNTFWALSSTLRLVSLGAEMGAARSPYMRAFADGVQIVNGGFNAFRQYLKRAKTEENEQRASRYRSIRAIPKTNLRRNIKTKRRHKS